MMIGRFRNALYNAIGNLDLDGAAPQNGAVTADGIAGAAGGNTTNGGTGGASSASSSSSSSSGRASKEAPRVKYAYQRPLFLQLFTDDEIQVTADHLVRPIMVPRDVSILPWYTGYAEAINAGKSLRNEDQASFHRGVLRTRDADLDCRREWEVPYIFFGTFDGHAGSGCAVAAANELHQVVHKKLMCVLHHLVPDATLRENGAPAGQANSSGSTSMWFPSRDISSESLIIGALESAFWEMDQQIGDDKRRYKMLGGCTVLVSLFILGKLYVANAGDSRAVLCRHGAPYPMSYDFTPVSERQRLQQLGYQKPQLLGSEYTHLDFCRRPLRKDVGKLMLYRDAHMTGWTYKEITQEDLKFPVVYGEGKRSRLLATIGVTRGFGDHDLRAQSQNGHIFIKPFLTPQPEVRVLDVENEELTEADVLVMATDGLWDVVTNEKVAEIVDKGMKIYEDADDARLRYRYISIAQDLVMAARGKLIERSWRRHVNNGNVGEGDGDGASTTVAATIDDISVTAIPVLAYKHEYEAWSRQQQLRDAHDNIEDDDEEENGLCDQNSDAFQETVLQVSSAAEEVGRESTVKTLETPKTSEPEKRLDTNLTGTTSDEANATATTATKEPSQTENEPVGEKEGEGEK